MLRIRLCIALWTAALLLGGVGLAAAEDYPDDAPRPEPAKGFDGRGTIVREGKAIGTFHLAASRRPRPDTPEGPAHWYLEDDRTWIEDGQDRRHTAVAWTDEDLQLVEGTLHEIDAWGSRTTYAWTRKGDRFHVDLRSEERTAMRREAAVESPALTTLAGLALRGRRATVGAAPLEMHLWDPSWDYLQAERPFTKGSLTVTRDGRWQDAPARVVTFSSSIGEIVVALTPDGRELMAAEIRTQGAAPLLLQPGEAPEPSDPDSTNDPFATPARSPEACALRVALAFLTADVDLFDETIHWPTLRTNHPGIVKGEVSDAAFRAAIRAQFEAKKQPPQPRERAVAFLRSIEDRLALAPNGDTETAVTLPEDLGRMRLTVGRVDGTWYLVRLPGT